MRLIGLLVGSLLLQGCQPNFYPYHVIDIPLDEGVEALASGEVDNDMVYFGETVTTSYRLTRQGYSVLGRLDFRTPHPAIDIAALNAAGAPLEIVPLQVGACGSFKTFGVHPEVNGYPALRYRWRPRWNEDCPIDDRGPYLPEQVIKFEVRAPSGQLLAVEEIPFALKRNGTYLEIDAL